MANTYVAIATVTVGSGGAANIEFTNIPGTYTDLLCVLSSRNTAGIDAYSYGIYMNINSSSANRTWRRLAAGNGTVYSDNGTTNLIGVAQGGSSTSNVFNSLQVYFPNYAGSSNKSLSVDAVTEGSTATELDFITGLWSQTNAISSISFSAVSGTPGNFVQYSTATLYGIKNS